jgi:hypothetical protein
VNQQNQGPMHIAIAFKHLDDVDLLIDRGFDVGSYLENPLVEAERDGSLEIVETLIWNGVDLNRSDSSGLSPLIAAVCAGRFQVVERLLELGVDVISRGTLGKTALMKDCDLRLDKITTFLLEKGANPLIRDSRRHKTIDFCHSHEIRIILQGFSFSFVQDPGPFFKQQKEHDSSERWKGFVEPGWDLDSSDEEQEQSEMGFGLFNWDKIKQSKTKKQNPRHLHHSEGCLMEKGMKIIESHLIHERMKIQLLSDQNQ